MSTTDDRTFAEVRDLFGVWEARQRDRGIFQRAWERAGCHIIYADVMRYGGIVIDEPGLGVVPVAVLPGWAEVIDPATRDGLLRLVRDEWAREGRADVISSA